MSGSTKQRLIFLAMLAVVVVTTHITYGFVNSGWVLYRRAENHYEKEEWLEAIVLYEQSFAAGLNHSITMHRLGDAYIQTKNFPKAIYWYKQYLETKPDDIWARRALAGALTATGQFDEARQEYKWVLNHKELEKNPSP